MNSDKRRERMAELMGIEAPVVVKPEEPEEKRQRVNREQTISREAEAVLAYFDAPENFISKQCSNCGSVFAHTRGSIAYCSDTCRQHALANIGIEWDPSKSAEDRWGNELKRKEALVNGKVTVTKYRESCEPLVVPPAVLPLVKQAFVANMHSEQEAPVNNQPPSEEAQLAAQERLMAKQVDPIPAAPAQKYLEDLPSW